MKSFAALAAIVPLVAAHGFIKSPAPRQPGDAYKAACGDQPYYQQTSDINGNVQGIMQVVGSDFDASTCNLWLCKGFLLADNTDLVQSYTAGETVDFEITIAAPHTGYANVSVVKTSSNSIIGTPLIEFTNYASNSGMPANNTAFSVTIPDDLGSECTTAGDCVLQWFWDAPDIDQTYESCVDFTVGGSSSGGSGSASSAVASSAAPAVTSAAATTAVAAVTEPAVTSAITPVASSAAAVTSAITPVASSAAAVVTSEAAATTSAAADEEECPADEDEGDDEDTGADDDEECPADEDEGDDEGDDEDDCDDEADETTIETTVAVAPTVAAVSVASSAAAQVTSAAASYAVPSAAQSGSSGSGNGNGSGAAVTSYVTVTGKPHTKTQMHTKYVTVTADAPACT